MATHRGTRTISRNAKRQIAEIQAKSLTCMAHTRRDNYQARECDPVHAWDDLARFAHARLTTTPTGWRVSLAADWYDLTPTGDTP